MGVLEVPVAPGDVRKVGCGGTGLGPNLLTTNQSGFESGTTTGWAVPGGFDAVLTAVTTPTPAAGSFCMAIEHTSTTGALPFGTPTGTAGMAVSPSAAYSITAQFRTSSGGTLNCKASWYDSAGTLIVANVLGEIPWSANDTWVAQAWTDTAPAGAAFLSVEFTVEHIDVNAKRAWIDQIDVHATASAPGRLRMELPGGSWVREACATDVDPDIYFAAGPTLSAGNQIVDFALHRSLGGGGWTLIVFRQNTSTLAVTRYEQAEDTTADYIHTTDVGAGYTVYAVVADDLYNTDAPGYAAWDDPTSPVWDLKWFASSGNGTGYTPIERHPLKNEDPANPGTWITVACMVPV